MKSMLSGAFSALLFSLVMVCGGAHAQTWPNRPITFIHGFEAGGATDVLTRAIGEELSRRLGQPAVIVAKPGAGGMIAAELAAHSPADGYTFYVALSSHAVAGALHKSLRYRPVEDFAWITLIHEFPFLIAVRSDSRITTFGDVINQARNDPESIRYGTAGIGAVTHLIGELASSTNSIKLLHVPFKSDVGVVPALVVGDIEMGILAPTAAIAMAKEGKIRLLAVTASQRWKKMPQVPTLEEAGSAPLSVSSWYAIAAPAGTPQPILDRLYRELQDILRLPTVSGRIDAMGSQAVLDVTPEMLRARVSSDLARWRKVVADAGISR